MRQQLFKSAACEERNQATLNLIAQTPSIETVILLTRWALYVNGERPHGESGLQADYLRRVGDTNMQTSPSSSGTLAADATKHVVEQLRAMGRRVIVIDSVPEMIHPVAETMLNHALLGAPQFSAPSPQAVADRNAKARRMLQALAQDPGVVLVSPADLICKDHCTYEVDGIPVYRDDDHLSDFGARLIVPALLALAREQSGQDF